MSAIAFDVDEILDRIERLPEDQQREALALLAPEITIKPHAEYRTDPIGWAVDKLGIPEHTLRWSLNAGYDAHDWDGTVEPLAAAFEAIRDWKDVAIESGTGTGKSFGVAILILWFLACFENAEVYTFALVEEQLKLYIWKNITELWPRFSAWFPTATLTSLCIRMYGGIDERWSAHGRAVQIKAGESVATRAAGMHAEHMLLVYEEMAGMDKSVPAAGKHTCTAPHNLRIGIGNPNFQLDTLHQMTQEAGVIAIRMSALDHPNVVSRNPSVVPGAVSQVSINKRLADVDGNEADPVYQSRVRGISPEQAANALIRLEWLKRSALRYEHRKANGTLPTRVTGKGVDCANSEHGDSAAICDFAENVIVRLDAFPCPDSNLLGATVATDCRGGTVKYRLPLEGRRVGVDAIGVGAGTVNEARRQGFIVQALYAGGKPMQMIEKAPDGKLVEWSPDVNQFPNLRSQMLWQMREDFRTDQIDAPKDADWWEELTAHTFEDHDKKTVVASKDEVKAVIGRSPDKSDASVMANWVRERAVVATVPVVPQGRTLGFDYASRRPAARQTAEEEIGQFLQRAQASPVGSRSAIPNRRGR